MKNVPGVSNWYRADVHFEDKDGEMREIAGYHVHVVGSIEDVDVILADVEDQSALQKFSDDYFEALGRRPLVFNERVKFVKFKRLTNREVTKHREKQRKAER